MSRPTFCFLASIWLLYLSGDLRTLHNSLSYGFWPHPIAFEEFAFLLSIAPPLLVPWFFVMWLFITTVPRLQRDHFTLGSEFELAPALPLLFCGVGILNSSAARQFPVLLAVPHWIFSVSTPADDRMKK
ncbi:hypothetical protein K443DRAFT_550368 [Laccaria amethystina LaAM-08-1]|jgi:hypothetical protein|uniref:Unplaced genomic scaffold K443scaffold_67, whole genome shotgun sequence n=1 Tax=Laccaria amethystina LaAM-08-1 TaxID=1095629 RepID=A0A0C9Y0X4_9AGAR|nr:hypothetical protein K443DRAFT_550368 [Laccaria amethystina LaAM-08-1]